MKNLSAMDRTNRANMGRKNNAIKRKLGIMNIHLEGISSRSWRKNVLRLSMDSKSRGRISPATCIIKRFIEEEQIPILLKQPDPRPIEHNPRMPLPDLH